MTATVEPNTNTHHIDGEIPAPDLSAQPDDLEVARGWVVWAAEKLTYWVTTIDDDSPMTTSLIDLAAKLAGVHAKIADVEEQRKHLAAVAEWRERDLAGQQLDRDLVRVLTPDRVAEVLAPAASEDQQELQFPSDEFEAAEAAAERAAGASG